MSQGNSITNRIAETVEYNQIYSLSTSTVSRSVLGWSGFFAFFLLDVGLLPRTCSQLSKEGKTANLFIDFKSAALAAEFKSAPSPNLLRLQRCASPRCLRSMNEGIIKKQNPKCRLYWWLIEFIGWRVEIQSVMLVFSTPLACCPSIISMTSSLPPSQSKHTVGGVELCCRPYSAGV